MKSLAELCAANNYPTDKADPTAPAHRYLAAYERYLGPYHNQIKTLWEIGVLYGGSLHMWKDWLPGAQVVGVDVRPPRADWDGRPNAWWEYGNATEEATIRHLLEKHGAPDVVIDDGSHMAADLRATFDLVWPHVRIAYAAEDLGTQSPNFEGGGYLRGAEPFTAYLARISEGIALGEWKGRMAWEPAQAFVFKETAK